MHSYHYFNTPKYHEIRPSEKYARSIGLEIEKQNWPNVIVKESPKYRHYKRLTDRYDAKWILDLHSNDAFKKLPKKTAYLTRFYCGYDSHSKESWPKSFNILLDLMNKKYPNEGRDVELAPRRPPNLIGVELFSQNPYSKSIKFVKTLVNHLYGSSL